MRHATSHGRLRAPGQSISLDLKGELYSENGGPREKTLAIARAWSRAFAWGVSRETANAGPPVSGGLPALAGA
jgi:hypothetical protein